MCHPEEGSQDDQRQHGRRSNGGARRDGALVWLDAGGSEGQVNVEEYC